MRSGISIKWKMLLTVLAAPLLVALLLAWERVADIRQGAEEAILQQSRAIVLMAEAGREEMAEKLKRGVMRPFTELPPDKAVEAVPVVTAMRTAARNAAEAGYEFRVPKVSPRNPKNAPRDIEPQVLQELEQKGLSEKIVFEKDRIRYFRAIRLTQDCLPCHGDPKGERDASGGVKEGWKEGEVHGAFEIISSLDKVHERVTQAKLAVAGWTAAILALLLAAAWVVLQRSVIGPLDRLKAFAGEVAGGKLDARAAGAYAAELGEVKGAIETMVETLKGKMVEAEARRAEADAHALRAEEALEAARGQEAKVRSLLDRMTGVARDAARIAQQVSASAEALSGRIDEVASGATRQSDRMTETAAAMEEMTASVLEVARSAGSSAKSAEEARTQAMEGDRVVAQAVEAIGLAQKLSSRLQQEMASLGGKAEDIGRIMEVISDIADQTNLLALNAAIEAARAGEAGRGFAVVADEVRKLAEKTMTATKEVGQAIVAIQEGTRVNIQNMGDAAKAVGEATAMSRQSGEALKRIVSLSEESSDQVHAIATAAEEQSATSEEINRAVDAVSQIASDTSDGMGQAAGAVAQLAQLARELESAIEKLTAP